VPGDVAKVLLSAARSGLRAVHLVAGDPFEHDAVVEGGPGRRPDRGGRSTVVPGVSVRPRSATYAGIALTV